jgi:hypothetical protein
VAVDENGHVIASKHPAGGASAWMSTRIDGGNELVGVSCPVTSMCVIVDADGNPVFSTNPSGGAGAWKITRLGVRGTFDVSVYCRTRSLCFLSDENGDLRVATTPTGGRTSWRRTARGVSVHEMSCWSRSGCVAATGSLLISSDPRGPARAWRVAKVPRDGLNSLDTVSCPSASLCVVGDSYGRVVTSRNPAASAPRWRVTSVNPGNGIGGISCVATRSCVGISSSEESTKVLVSRNPAGGGGAWSRVKVRIPVTKQFGVPSVSCPSVSVCAAIDSADEVLASTTGSHRKWRATGLDGDPNSDVQPGLTGLSCPSPSLCVAVDNGGRTFASTRPTKGGWSATSIDPASSLEAISCPTATFCAAVDAAGNVLTSRNPAGGAATWTATPVDRAASLVSVSCASRRLCVAGDAAGRVVVGRA